MRCAPRAPVNSPERTKRRCELEQLLLHLLFALERWEFPQDDCDPQKALALAAVYRAALIPGLQKIEVASLLNRSLPWLIKPWM